MPSFLGGSSSFLQITRPTIKARMSLNFGKIPSRTLELAALERQKKIMNNIVTTLAPSFIIGSSSFFQTTRKPIISGMSSRFTGSDKGLMSYLHLSVWKNPHRLIMEEML